MSFKNNLAELPEIGNVKKVVLYDDKGIVLDEILNTEGTSGSCRVYASLVDGERKVIDIQKANKGLEIFGEYTAEAREDKNSHPNIQRLISVIDNSEYLEAEVIRN